MNSMGIKKSDFILLLKFFLENQWIRVFVEISSVFQKNQNSSHLISLAHFLF